MSPRLPSISESARISPAHWARAALLFFLCAGAGPAVAEEPDFSAGFEKLKALGLPDLTGAKWVRETGGENEDSSGYGSYYLRQLLERSAGNAWLLPDGKQVVGAGQIVPRAPHGEVSGKAGGGGGLLSALGNAFSGKSSTVDPEADAQALLKGLEDESSGRMENVREDPLVLSRLFLFAAQLHAAGHKEQANKLAAAVLALPSDPSRVIDSAITALANDHCRAALETFYEEGDWKALSVKLSQAAARYTRGWSRRDDIAALAAKIQAQSAKGPPLPAPLEPSSAALSKAVLAWLSGSAAAEESKPESQETPVESESTSGEEESSEEEPQAGNLWTLEAPEGEAPAFLSEGMKVLPVLIPLLADETLTVLPSPQKVVSEEERFSFDSRPQELPDSFVLPATRSALAGIQLRKVIPNSTELDSGALQAAAAAFWKANAKKSPVELASVYLKEGDYTQQECAGEWLSRCDAAGAEDAFAEWALQPEQMLTRLDTTREYIRRRREAAAPFLEKLAAALREKAAKPAEPEPEPEEFDYSRQSRRTRSLSKEQAEGVIRSLQLLTSAKGLEDSLMNIASAKEPAGPVLKAMSEELAKDPPEKVLPAMLKAAVAATPANRPALLNTAGLLLQLQHREENVKLPDMKDALREPLLALLANKEPIPVTERGRFGAASIGENAALLDAMLHDQESFTAGRELHALTGEPITPFLITRATARLGNQPVPDWPSADGVKPERLKELVAGLEGKAPGEVIKALQALTLEERAAVFKWTKRPGALALPDSLKAMRAVIHSSTAFSMYGPGRLGSRTAELAAAAGLSPGAVLSAGLFTSQAKTLLAGAKDQSPRIFMVSGPGLLNLGWSVTAFEADSKAEPLEDEDSGGPFENAEGKVALSSLDSYFREAAGALKADEKATAVATLWIYRRDTQPVTHWLLQPDGTITESHSSGNVDGDSKPATEALTELLAVEKPDRATILFTVITREQAKVFDTKSE